MRRIGFDNDRYIEMQSGKIRERIEKFGGKLYLEFGGKLFDDYHASRVLPGFRPDSKLNMLLALREQAEIIIAISAYDIEKNKVRGDLGITYDLDVLRLIDAFRVSGLYVGSVVLTQYASQPAAKAFRQRLKELGVKTYRHYPIEGYPNNTEKIVSQEGYGRNDPDLALARRRDCAGAGQRQNGRLPLAALSRKPARREGRLRQVRDFPDLEPAAQASRQRRV